MTKNSIRPAFNVFATFVLFAICVVLTSGCSRSGGLSDFEKAQKKKDNAADALRALGAEVSPVTYPNYGEGWAVKLRGAKMTTEMFDQMKALKRVSDLDVSKSDITDDQLAKLSEQDVGTMIVKLNLSNTSITDAGVDNLKLPLLTHLTVTGSKISNAAIDRLKQRRASDPRLPPFKVVK